MLIALPPHLLWNILRLFCIAQNEVRPQVSTSRSQYSYSITRCCDATPLSHRADLVSLPRNQVPEWSSAYINYKGLKKLIKHAAANPADADLAGMYSRPVQPI
jgi:hypothetical protein